MSCATELDKALFDENAANFAENAANLKQAECKFMWNRVEQRFDFMWNKVGQSIV